MKNYMIFKSGLILTHYNCICILVLSLGRWPYEWLERVGDLKKKKPKVTQSLYMPVQAHRVPAGWDSQISRELVHEVVSLLALSTGCLNPPGIFLIVISVRGWVDPRGHSAVRIMSMKNSSDTIWNWTCGFWLIAQCLNHLRHQAPLC